ncbi:methyl-accepting chemotaxis protein [Geminocystis sp. NIES-3709]|uniref:methyl-accepting chemotaxis protein n=1 Tax=Geminocystis sp. NIES-3709 TaxID=1617448 RepID=UPI0005FCCC47|nr:HAMP domain-containing methyl-accepting chemotaxis protein [Geminocystis sp. NIES-3709]BAQ63305.1 methyl-accepting chemotaxis protein (MCP) homologue [Geminocystis sp. NIES-3709]
MNQLQQETANSSFSDEIKFLQNNVTANPKDLTAKLSLATVLEQEQYYHEAIEVYRSIIEQDTDKVFTDTANKAIEEINKKYLLSEEDDESKINKNREKTTVIKNINLWQQFKDLPIAYKQFIALLIASLVSTVGVIIAGRVITTILGKNQLEKRAISELNITSIDYNSNLENITSGFRGKADNIGIIETAKTYKAQGKIDPILKNMVRTILNNEIKARGIEYATLVGLNGRIIVNANKDRFGQSFILENLVSQVIKTREVLETNVIIPRKEIIAENPSFASKINSENVLMNVSLTPVNDFQSQQMIGVLMAGELVNDNSILLEDIISAMGGGYNAIYMFKNDDFHLVTSIFQPLNSEEFKANIPLLDISLLEKLKKENNDIILGRMTIENQSHTIAIKPLPDFEGENIAFLVRGTPEASLQQIFNQSVTYQIIVGFLSLIVALFLASYFSKILTQPIEKLQISAEKIGSGDRSVRAKVTSRDEVGKLAQTFNEMAEKIDTYTKEIEEIAQKREKEVEIQRQQRENLQENVINLLLDIEKASKGNLSIQAEVVSGEVGSIADAFNATMRSLEGLVKQVVVSTNQLNETALSNGESVNHLAQNSYKQDNSIQIISTSIQEITNSIEKISESAQNAAVIASKSRFTAQEGQSIINETVNNIYQIRHTVADTAKKAKRLADSSQEISKIVNIISGISEKTNLLAFNASIEAARAGENGQGFRVVADEVRRLAEQVTFSTQEIEQLVEGIQEETSEMMTMMEQSSTQVVSGTKLVQNTKETLQKLSVISNEIDTLLQSISESTINQKLISQKVNKKMEEVAIVTKEIAEESNTVSQSLQELVTVAMEMQKSASRFQVSQS